MKITPGFARFFWTFFICSLVAYLLISCSSTNAEYVGIVDVEILGYEPSTNCCNPSVFISYKLGETEILDELTVDDQIYYYMIKYKDEGIKLRVEFEAETGGG